MMMMMMIMAVSVAVVVMVVTMVMVVMMMARATTTVVTATRTVVTVRWHHVVSTHRTSRRQVGALSNRRPHETMVDRSVSAAGLA